MSRVKLAEVLKIKLLIYINYSHIYGNFNVMMRHGLKGVSYSTLCTSLIYLYWLLWYTTHFIYKMIQVLNIDENPSILIN